MQNHAFLKILDRLNRKERFHLLRMATNFGLDKAFLDIACGAVGLSPPHDASDCFFAFDYHIDWLAAAVQLYNEKQPSNIEKRFQMG